MVAIAASTDTQIHCILSHILRLRSLVYFKDAYILLMIESNHSLITTFDVWQKLSAIPRLVFLKGHQLNLAPGVRTTDVVKETGVWMTTELMKQNYIQISETFFTNSLPPDGNILSPLVSQLKALERKRVADRANGSKKMIITGKTNGKNDDLVISLILLVYWAFRFECTPNYGMTALRGKEFSSRKIHPINAIQEAVSSRTWEQLSIQFRDQGRISVSDANGGLYNITTEQMIHDLVGV